MNIVIAVICVFGTAAAIIFISSLELGAWLKAGIVTPLVLLAVYSMARIPSSNNSETKTGA